MLSPAQMDQLIAERSNDAAVQLVFELEHFVGPLHPRSPMYWRRHIAQSGDAMANGRGRTKYFVHHDDLPYLDLVGPPTKGAAGIVLRCYQAGVTPPESTA